MGVAASALRLLTVPYHHYSPPRCQGGGCQRRQRKDEWQRRSGLLSGRAPKQAGRGYSFSLQPQVPTGQVNGHYCTRCRLEAVPVSAAGLLCACPFGMKGRASAGVKVLVKGRSWWRGEVLESCCLSCSDLLPSGALVSSRLRRLIIIEASAGATIGLKELCVHRAWR